MPNYYDILHVCTSADPEIIQAAYRKLAQKYHPDRNHNEDAEELMKRLNEAFSVLSDPHKRLEYDALIGKQDPQQQESKSQFSKRTIVFSCPACATSVEMNLSESDAIVICPSCDQRINLRASSYQKSRYSNVYNDKVFSDEVFRRVALTSQVNLTPGNTYFRARAIFSITIYLVLLALISLLNPASTGAAVLKYIYIAIATLALVAYTFYAYQSSVRINNLVYSTVETIRVIYSNDSFNKSQFDQICSAIDQLICRGCWTVEKKSAELVKKGSRILTGSCLPFWLKTNIVIPRLSLFDYDFFFFPDRIIGMNGASVISMDYSNIDARVSPGKIFLGNNVVGHTWLHSRVDGGPDRRHKINYKIPIYEPSYSSCSVIRLRLDELIFCIISESRVDATQFEDAISAYSRII